MDNMVRTLICGLPVSWPSHPYPMQKCRIRKAQFQAASSSLSHGQCSDAKSRLQNTWANNFDCQWSFFFKNYSSKYRVLLFKWILHYVERVCEWKVYIQDLKTLHFLCSGFETPPLSHLVAQCWRALQSNVIGNRLPGQMHPQNITLLSQVHVQVYFMWFGFFHSS